MNGIAERLAKQIKAGNDVIIYGAGMEGENLVFSLKENFSAEPVCFCDGDQAKWHQKLLHIEILSIDEALDSYPEAFIYISSSLHKHQIIGYLTEQKGINPQQIINYERVEKRKSCALLETQMVVMNHKLQFCCSDFGKKTSPALEFNGNYRFSIKKFLDLRNDFIDRISHSLPTSCDGCPCIEETYYAVDKRIEELAFSENGVCNLSCCYCESIAKCNKQVTTDIQLQDVLDNLIKQKCINESLRVDVACGEISVHPQKSEIYKTLFGYTGEVLTNSVLYDNELASLLYNGYTIMVSVDAGTAETYLKVKGKNVFDTVRKNLKKYYQNGNVQLKFIFLPGVNDNVQDINGFLELCKEIKASLVLISYDFRQSKIIPSKTKEMVAYFFNEAQEVHLPVKNLIPQIVGTVI